MSPSLPPTDSIQIPPLPNRRICGPYHYRPSSHLDPLDPGCYSDFPPVTSSCLLTTRPSDATPVTAQTAQWHPLLVQAQVLSSLQLILLPLGPHYHLVFLSMHTPPELLASLPLCTWLSPLPRMMFLRHHTTCCLTYIVRTSHYPHPAHDLPSSPRNTLCICQFTGCLS